MTRPVVSSTAEVVYAGLQPWTAPDEDQDWALLIYVSVLTAYLTTLDDLVRDTDEYPGWSALVDVDRAPTKALPYLGQFVGVRVDSSLTDQEQRDQIRSRQGFQRGTPAAIAAAAQPHLTGTKTVILDERFEGDAYALRVSTFTTETPDPTVVMDAVIAQKPAGIVLTYETRDGLTYDEIAASGKTYDQLTTEFPTSDSMRFSQSV